MKRIILVLVIVAIALTSCSKKGVTPVKSKGVLINGTVYDTVRIGNQTWTTVNYNGPGGINYNNGPNVAIYGKLYTRGEADSIKLPQGWRVPNAEDFQTLTNNIDDGGLATGAVCYQLMATTTWTDGLGTNSSGFNAIATGDFIDTTFYDVGYRATFLVSTPYTSPSGDYPQDYNIYSSVFSSTITTPIDVNTTLAADKASLRFIKDN